MNMYKKRLIKYPYIHKPLVSMKCRCISRNIEARVLINGNLNFGNAYVSYFNSYLSLVNALY